MQVWSDTKDASITSQPYRYDTACTHLQHLQQFIQPAVDLVDLHSTYLPKVYERSTVLKYCEKFTATHILSMNPGMSRKAYEDNAFYESGHVKKGLRGQATPCLPSTTEDASSSSVLNRAPHRQAHE